MTQRRLTAILVGTLLFSVGCASAILGGKQDGVDLYYLTPPATIEGAGLDGIAALPWHLAIAEPRATGLLSGDRILAHLEPSQLQPIAGIRWADRVPDMLHTLLLETFETSAKVATVSRADLGATADYLLVTELRLFQARYEARLGAPQVQLRIAAQLVAGQRVAATKRFDHSVTAASNEPDAIVQAANEVVSRVLSDLVAWTLTVS